MRICLSLWKMQILTLNSFDGIKGQRPGAGVSLRHLHVKGNFSFYYTLQWTFIPKGAGFYHTFAKILFLLFLFGYFNFILVLNK